MKRNILIIFFCALLIFTNSKVYATEASFSIFEKLGNIANLKHDDVYYYFYYAYAIRNTDTKNMAYCIEPFTDLIEKIPYTGYKNYDSKFGFSKELWDKLKLLSYYGYGYKNHTDEKWINITQVAIWREVDPRHTFEWIDNVYDRNVVKPYEKELKELYDLVNNHAKLPNIDKEITLSINSTATLEDSNLVLNDFKIKDSTIDASIEDNKLIINTKNSGGEITLIKEGALKKDSEFFYNSSSQKIIERGNYDPIEYKIKVNVESGSIKIIKVDSDTESLAPQGEASLVGAVYDVLDTKGKSVGEIKIGSDNTGLLSNVAYGKYVIKEKSPGTGYLLDEEEYEVEIGKDNLDIVITLKNKVVERKVKLIKYYGNKEEYENNSMKKEKNVTFEIYDKNNTLIYTDSTDDDGTIEVILPYGNYLVKQISTTSNYEKVEDFTIVIDENSPSVIEIVLNDLEIEVPDAYIDKGILSLFMKILAKVVNHVKTF